MKQQQVKSQLAMVWFFGFYISRHPVQSLWTPKKTDGHGLIGGAKLVAAVLPAHTLDF